VSSAILGSTPGSTLSKAERGCKSKLETTEALATEGCMAYYKDVREYLQALENNDKLVRIKQPINKDT
jgi:hypothetical protein